MKRIIYLLFFLVVINYNNVHSQLIASIDSKIYGNYLFKPVKAGKSFKYKLKIKNISNQTQTFSINKHKSFYHYNWITIPYSYYEKSISAERTIIYDVIVKVPLGRIDGHNNNEGIYVNINNNLVLLPLPTDFLVDNTPPTNVTIKKKKVLYNSVTVDVSAFDELSNIFTSANNTSNFGKKGIERFNLELKTLSGKTVGTQRIDTTESWNNVWINGNMEGNTKHRIYVTATDLAGNTSSPIYTEFITPPSAPTNLSTSNVKYYDFILNWSESDGATSYEIYDVTKGSKKIATTSATNYHITGLKLGETRKYKVRAKSQYGTSNDSEILYVKTLNPHIVGASFICNEDTEVYQIEEFLEGTPVKWKISDGSSIEIVSGQNTPNVVIKAELFKKSDLILIPFAVGGKEEPILTAKITIGSEVISISKKIEIGSSPNFRIGVDGELPQDEGYLLLTGLLLDFVADKTDADGYPFSNYEWLVKAPAPPAGKNPQEDFVALGSSFRYMPLIPGDYKITLTATGKCGTYTSHFTKKFKGVYIPKPVVEIYPNPTNGSSYVNVHVPPVHYNPNFGDGVEDHFTNENPNEGNPSDEYGVQHSIRIYNNTGLVKSINAITQETYQLSVQGLPKGFYYVHVVMGSEIIRKQLIIK